MGIDKEELRKIKDQGARYLKMGKWDKALEKFQELVKYQPKDLRLKMKLGDIQAKMKMNAEAIKTYIEVAEAYTQDKFLIQAVSVYKLVQTIDPKNEKAQAALDELNKARGIPAAGSAAAAAAPPDAEPGLPAAAAPVPEDEKSLVEQIEEVKQKKEEQAKDSSGAWRFPETPLFGQLGEQEFAEVIGKFQVGRIPKGTVVIKQGTKGDSFFIVSQGDIRVYRVNPKNDKKVTLAHLKDGAFFGEMAFFLDSVRTAFCETAEDTVLLRINRKDLEELMARHPNIRVQMMNFFKRRALDQLFKTMNLFASLEDAEREVLLGKFEMVVAEPGTEIIREGEEGEYLWVIFSGGAEVTTQHEDKGTVKLADLGPGDYCGEISLIQGKLNTADVVTSQKSVLFRLSRAVFMELLAIHSPMLEELTSVIEARLRNTVTALLKA